MKIGGGIERDVKGGEKAFYELERHQGFNSFSYAGGAGRAHIAVVISAINPNAARVSHEETSNTEHVRFGNKSSKFFH